MKEVQHTKPIINPEAIQYLQKRDPIFTKIIEKYGLPPNHQRPATFESLVHMILEQQVSIDSAKAVYVRLKNHLSHFEPADILRLEEQHWIDIGVTRRKQRYIKNLAIAIQNEELQLPKLEHLSVDNAQAELTKIVGIGKWTAEIYLMFCLQSPDIFPIGDIAIIRALQMLTDLPDKEAMLVYSENWKPYRSAATYLLWHYYLGEKGRAYV